MAKAKLKKTQAQKATIDLRYLGPEPEPFEVTDGYDSRLTAALRWYGYMYSQDEGKSWLLKYVKANYSKDIYNAVKAAPAWKTSMTAATMVHLLDRGAKLHESNLKFIDEKVRENASYVKNEDEPSPQAALNPHARLQRKIEGQLADLEEMLDNAIFEGAEFNFYIWANGIGAAPQFLIRVKDKYTPVLEELTTEPDLKGKYVEREKDVLGSMLEDIERLQTNKSTKRKAVRASKPLTTDKQVKGLKYKADDNKLKLVSISPTQIIGSRELWVYNTKYNELGVFVATTDMGLKVKGTSIDEVDATKSFVKKVRDPSILGDVLKGKPHKAMSSLKTAAKPISTRIGEHTILLRVIK